MGERLINRVFNQALTADQRAAQEQDAQRSKAKRTADDDVRDTCTPMQASDAIKRILLAKKDKDWFRCATKHHSSPTSTALHPWAPHSFKMHPTTE